MNKNILIFFLSFILGNIAHGQGIISTIAGDSTSGYNGDGIAATAALLKYPEGVAMDTKGNLYIGDVGNNRIRKIDPAGIITTIGGTGVAGCNGDGGPATNAQLNARYIATDAEGNIYLTDPLWNRVRKITMSGLNAGMVTTIAGTGIAGFSGDGGPAVTAQFNQPMGVAVAADGSVYVSDNMNGRIRMINPMGVVFTIAGGGISLANGVPAITAQIIEPRNITLDNRGNIYFCAGNRVFKINSAGNISAFAGTESGGGPANNVAATASALNRPEGIVVDQMGNVLICEAFYSRIRKVNTADTISFLRIVGPNALMFTPIGLTIDAAGSLYISEYGLNRIRKITDPLALPTISNEQQQITLSPNPCHNNLIMTIPAAQQEHVQVIIINITGQIVQTIEAFTGKKINLTLEVPPGIYTVNAISPGRTWHQQLMVY